MCATIFLFHFNLHNSLRQFIMNKQAIDDSHKSIKGRFGNQQQTCCKKTLSRRTTIDQSTGLTRIKGPRCYTNLLHVMSCDVIKRDVNLKIAGSMTFSLLDNILSAVAQLNSPHLTSSVCDVSWGSPHCWMTSAVWRCRRICSLRSRVGVKGEFPRSGPGEAGDPARLVACLIYGLW